MNTKLQKWTEKKQKTLIKWSKEYDRLCKEEGIKENNIINMAFSRASVSGIFAFDKSKAEKEYLINTEAWYDQKLWNDFRSKENEKI